MRARSRIGAVSGLLTAAMTACSSPPPPSIPPRDEIGPPLPAATECFPPYPKDLGQAWFILADLDLGTSCRVFLEQDECVLGIFDDCTDPSAASRQWIGQLDTEMVRNLVQFQIYPGSGGGVGRPPKCCSGEVIDNEWSRLDCKLAACDNLQDKVHVGAILEREAMVMPFASSAGREEITGASALSAFALLPGKQELWTVSESEILVHELGGLITNSLANVTDARHLIASPDESMLYVADGAKLIRIDTTLREIAEMVVLSNPIELLEHSSRGLLVGATDGRNMTLSLRRPTSIATVDAEVTLMPLAAIIEIPNGTVSSTFMAAPESGDLMVLTSSLAPGNGPQVDKPARAFIAIDARTIGYLAECSPQSTERHCFFEIDLGSNAIRRTGIPDIGEIIDATYHAATDRVIFSGMEGLGVLDRADWRPLVQQRVEIQDVGPLAISGSDLYALGKTGFVERFTLR